MKAIFEDMVAAGVDGWLSERYRPERHQRRMTTGATAGRRRLANGGSCSGARSIVPAIKASRHLRRLIGVALVSTLALAACGGSSTVAIEVVQPPQAAQVLEERAADVVLLDVRTPEEFIEVRVPGSVNVDYYAADFAAQLDALPKDVPYVVYCRSGNRSSKTMDIMADLGFSEVFDVAGGIIAWNEAGLPLEN
jgi:rhodanese-related sulfurtransferase